MNRAIFYAAAKRGFKTQARPQRLLGQVAEKADNTSFLGDEMAYTSKKGTRLYFTIGGTPQTEADFRRQVEARFGTQFMKAWKDAISIVNQYDDDVLRSQKRFFNDVYRPRRDQLASKWSEMSD